VKHSFLILFIILVAKISEGQESGNQIYIQGGATVAFLYKIPQNYGGPLGSYTAYDIQNLKPLPGFVSGVVSEPIISKTVFFRFGGLVSYHASAMTINTITTAPVYGLVDKKENIKTRVRNLYIQLPLEFGISFFEKKSFAIYGGVKIGYRLLNESTWNYMHTSYNFEISNGGTVVFIDSIGPKAESSELPTHSSDIAVEIGFRQSLNDHLSVEERIDASLISTVDFGDAVEAPTLNQVVGEIVLCWKLNKRPKK